MRQIPRGWPDPAPLFRHGDRGLPGSRKLLDFGVSVNPLGPPQSVLRALREGCAAVAHYPDPDCRLLAERLAEGHGCERGQVVVGNGANDLIYTLTRAVRPHRVAIAEPTYTEYLRAALLAGAEVTHWLAEGPDFDPEPFDPEGADLVWLCNPNNPTGGLWPAPDELAAWIAAHPRTLFAVDEAFLPLTREGDEPQPPSPPRRGRGAGIAGGMGCKMDCIARAHTHAISTPPLSPSPGAGARGARSVIPEVGRLTNLVVLRSLTKFYALPGLRLGYAVASPEWAERLRTQIVPWSVNALAQIAGLTALADEGFARHTRVWLVSEASTLGDRLAAISERIRPLRGETSFVLVELSGRTAAEVVAGLARRGFGARDASNFVGLDPRYIRVAARAAEENARLLEALAEVCEDARGAERWPGR